MQVMSYVNRGDFVVAFKIVMGFENVNEGKNNFIGSLKMFRNGFNADIRKFFHRK